MKRIKSLSLNPERASYHPVSNVSCSKKTNKEQKLMYSLNLEKMGSIFTLLEEMAKVSHQIHNWEGYGGALYNLLKAVEEVDGEADFPRERLFPALPEAVASFGRICPQDAID